MLQLYIKAGVLKYYDRLYRNPWFLVKKKCGKYCIVNATMNANQYTICDVNFSLNIKEFVERSTGMTVILLIDFYSRYNQIELYPELCDMTAFQTLLGLL